MSVVNREKLNKLMDLVLKDAETKRLDAGYSGRFDDGGATHLEEQVKFFKYGLAGTQPPEWSQYEKQLDPEWLEYLRLQKKFGGR